MSPAAVRRRESPAPLAVLREARVAAPEVIARAVLEDVSRSHSVAYAELPDGSRFVVKRLSPRARADGRALAPELFVYRLASWQPELARVLPEAVHLDERNQVLVLVACDPEHLYPAQCMTPGFPSPRLAAALGRGLARLHAATEDLPLPTLANCGVLRLPDAPPEERGVVGGSAAAVALAEEVAADPGLAQSLRRAREVLRPTCLVHSDVKWDNCVLDPGPPARVRLFDWELSGRGDPAWDLGGALADTLAVSVRLAGERALASEPAGWLSPPMRALLGAYAGRKRGDLAERTVGCWIGRSVHLAIECTSSTEDAHHPLVRDLLGAARSLAEEHDALVEAVDDALAAAG